MTYASELANLEVHKINLMQGCQVCVSNPAQQPIKLPQNLLIKMKRKDKFFYGLKQPSKLKINSPLHQKNVRSTVKADIFLPIFTSKGGNQEKYREQHRAYREVDEIDGWVILQTYTCSWSSEVVMLFWESLVIDGMSMCRKYEKEPNQILIFCKGLQGTNPGN